MHCTNTLVNLKDPKSVNTHPNPTWRVRIVLLLCGTGAWFTLRRFAPILFRPELVCAPTFCTFSKLLICKLFCHSNIWVFKSQTSSLYFDKNFLLYFILHFQCKFLFIDFQLWIILQHLDISLYFIFISLENI